MTLKETIRTSEEYVKVLQQADAEWEAQSNTPDWTFEVLKDPRLRTRPSERERLLVLKDFETNRHMILKDRGVSTNTLEGYVFDRVKVGSNGVAEFWTKGAVNE